jgi:lipooligosaccharide transport system permease protein
MIMRPSQRATAITERNALVYFRLWYMFISGFLEPIFYLLSIGIGVGKLVGGVEFNGHEVAYAHFVAPGLMASAAMNGAVFDSTFSIFFKLKYMKLYDAVVATPVSTTQIARGELLWSLFRCGSYALVFLLAMTALGFTDSWLAVLALPAAILIGFSFSAAGMALTSFMRGWRDFDFINLSLIPLFLFSATFNPLSVYPRGLQLVVQLSPLYHGCALIRGCTQGELGLEAIGHVAYLVVVGVIGMGVVSRRLEGLLLH